MGLYIVVIASTVYALGWVLYSSTFMPNFEEQYAASQIKEMVVSGVSANEIQMAKEEMDGYVKLFKNPLIKLGFSFLEIFPIGLLASLVSAFFLRRKRT